jgi:hypothetical protein
LAGLGWGIFETWLKNRKNYPQPFMHGPGLELPENLLIKICY